MAVEIKGKDLQYDIEYVDGSRSETTFHLVKKNAYAVYLVQSGNKKYIENKEGLVAFDLEAIFYLK